MREHFLKEYRHGTYMAMLLMGSFTTHLEEIDRQAEEEVECLHIKYTIGQLLKMQKGDE